RLASSDPMAPTPWPTPIFMGIGRRTRRAPRPIPTRSTLREDIMDATETIGTARMNDDRTIQLRLRTLTGEALHGEAQLEYGSDHPQYQAILDHLGGLDPGQTKLVAPWPDDFANA